MKETENYDGKYRVSFTLDSKVKEELAEEVLF
jgi:hypothetical protein